MTERHPLLEFLAERGAGLSPLLILTHNHPDPDAIASAWALAYLGQHLCGIRSRIVYGGIIGRMENQTMVRTLRVPLQPVRSQDFIRFPHVAMVDTQPPFQNNSFPSRRRATIVIDHHCRHPRTQAELVLIDETAGATTTLLAEMLLVSGVEIPSRLATALVYGIGSETQNLGREAGPRDVDAYRTLFSRASMRALSRIQNPPRPSSFFDVVAKAIRRAFLVRHVIGVHLGPVPSSEIVAEMADFLLSHERVRWSMVTGRYEGQLLVSLRTRNPRARAGTLLSRLLGAGGSAGGHGMMAGGAIWVGKTAEYDVWQEAEERLIASFLRSQGFKEPFEFQYPYRELVREEREA